MENETKPQDAPQETGMGQQKSQNMSAFSVPASIIGAGIIVAIAIVYSNGGGSMQTGQPTTTSVAQQKPFDGAKKFQECLASGKFAAHIESDLQEAIAAGGRGTPYSVVVSASGKTFPVNGALPYAQVKAIIDDAISDKGTDAKLTVRAVSNEDHVLGDRNAPVKLIEFSDLECPFCKRFHPTAKQVVTEYAGKVALVYRHFPLDSLHAKARKEAEATECANEQGGNDKFWAYMDRLFDVTPSNDGLDLAELPKIAAFVGLE